MGFSKWFSAWINPLRSRSGRNAPFDRRSAHLPRGWFQPRVELLEDRCLLSAGALDPTFGLAGMTIPDPNATAKAVAVEGDGKIVMLDQTNAGYDILRFNTDGSPDTTFGANGTVAATFGYGTTVLNLAVLSDGQIVVGGDNRYNTGPSLDQIEFLDIARFNRDGTPDTTYGSAGIAEFDVSGDANSIANVAPADMAVRADGTVVVAGTSTSAIALVQIAPTGALDPSFGAGGVVTTALAQDAQATGIVLEGDGKIVVTGGNEGELALLRYNADGSLDTTFGNGGIASEALPGATFAGARVAVDSSTNQLVVSADSYTATDSQTYWTYGQDYFGLFRFNDNGSLDTTFGAGGQVTTANDTTIGTGSPGQMSNNLAVQADGKILVGVNTFGSSLVDRYNSNGSIDLTYGNGGTANISNIVTGYGYNLNSPFLALQGDGKLVVASNASGWNGVDGASSQDVVVTRLQADSDLRPTQFGSAQALQQYLIDQAVQQYSYLFGRPYYPIFYYPELMLAAAVSVGYSTTNLQVAGVDEGDIVKTDGHYLYLLSNGNLVILNAAPAASLQTLSVTYLPGDPVAEYLDGNRLTVISQENPFEIYQFPRSLYTAPALALSPFWAGNPLVFVTVYDVSNPAAPAIVQQTTLDGAYDSSRAVGATVYVGVNDSLGNLPGPGFVPGIVPVPWFAFGAGYVYESEAQYIASLEAIPLDSPLPHYTTYYTDANGPELITGLISQPADIYEPSVAGDTNLVSLVSFDVADGGSPGPTNSVTLMTSYNATLYAATDNFYLITSRSSFASGEWTFIDQLNIQNGGITLTATGAVPGQILSQFSVSENGPYLYVATSSAWGNDTTNNLYVLTADGPTLDVVGQLDNLAAGQWINAVTFIGSSALISTSSPTNPLFAVDLSNPTDPVVAGSLEVSGIVQYLQPIDATHLIGIGYGVDPTTGYETTIQISLFDVSKLSNPTLLSTYDVGPSGSWSAALDDTHAITYDPATQTLALPISSQTEVTSPYGWLEWVSQYELLVLHVNPASGTLALQGEVSDVSPMQRSVVIGNTLYAISETSVQAAALNDLNAPIAQVLLPPYFTLWWGIIVEPGLPIVVGPIFLPVTIVVTPIYLNPNIPTDAGTSAAAPVGPTGPFAVPPDNTSGNSSAVVTAPAQAPATASPIVIGTAGTAPTDLSAIPESPPIFSSAIVIGIGPTLILQYTPIILVNPAPPIFLETFVESGFLLAPDGPVFWQPVVLWVGWDPGAYPVFFGAIDYVALGAVPL